MPLSNMTLSKSPRPGGIQHTIHNKPSSPIQIPRRRRPMSSMNNSSPIGRQVSPDLIFEMSPVPTDFPSPSHYALGCSESVQYLDAHEPFMYSFPAFAIQRDLPSGFRTPSFQKTICPISASPPVLAISAATATHRRSQISLPRDDDDMLPPSLTSSSTTTVTKITSTTKINGFTPITPNSTQPCSPVRSLKTRRLSPPPRSSSYSSSPWILPGKSDALDEENESGDIDPSSFEFERYLMRRIEKRSPLRFRGASLVSAVRR